MAAQNEETDALVKAFETYKQRSQMLATLLESVENVYSAIEKCLKEIDDQTPELEGTSLNLSDLLLNRDEKAKVTRTFQEPSIIFVGQTNSGKSSLINEILGATVVKADDTPCTARIVQLSYGDNDKPIIEVRDKNGKLLQKTELTKSFIPSSVVNLKKQDRDKKELIQSKVFAKMKIPFLKSGVNIIDSPGKNENDQLDSLVDEHMNSVLPLVVYVIDGTTLLSTQDISDIGSLYRCVPQGNMFFVVTKCDTEDEESTSDEEGNERSPKDYTQPTDLEIMMRDGVYKKLVENKFLKDLPISQCKNYHTLSSRRVKMYRREIKSPSSATNATRLYKRYMDDFNKFKTCLLDFTRQQLIQTVTDSAKVVQCSLMKCLDYFIDQSNKIFNDRSENENNIKLIQMEEQMMSLLLQTLVKDATKEFAKAVAAVVDQNRDHIIKKARKFKFVQYNVPHNGYIESQSVEGYKEELGKEILNEITGIIHRDVVNKCGKLDEIFKNVSARVSQVQEKIGNQIPIYDALQQMFVSNYKFSLNKVDLTKSLFQNIKHVFRSIWSVISMKRLREKISGVNVADEKWKQSVAEEILELVHADNVAERIVNGIVDHINQGHDNFQKQLAELRILYEKSTLLGERDQLIIRKMAPIIGRLELCSWNIIDQLRFTDLKYGKILGKGAQGVVLECDAKGPKGEKCVAKLIKLENENEMGEISLEIHYCRKLDHEHIAKVFGTIYVELEGNMYELAIIMPRLERDLLVALPKLPQLSLRLQIALQIASALSYMHQKGMMHRDIKAANILLDINNQVKITDFGLCKPPGISNVSFVGTPVHMAPEIIKQQPYSPKVDVYAFGILLWYICEGAGNHPKYVYNHSMVQGLLVETALGRRPERLKTFRDDCWEMMERCWADEPLLRPEMDTVITELRDIVRQA